VVLVTPRRESNRQCGRLVITNPVFRVSRFRSSLRWQTEDIQMHSAIVYAVMPTSPYDAKHKAAVMLNGLAKLENMKAFSQLGEFVWEVNFHESPVVLATLVSVLEQLEIPYGMLQLDDAPQWIQRDPKENMTFRRDGTLVK
jgi:hypothetical protein